MQRNASLKDSRTVVGTMLRILSVTLLPMHHNVTINEIEEHEIQTVKTADTPLI